MPEALEALEPNPRPHPEGTPNEMNVDCALEKLINVVAFFKFPPSPGEVALACVEQLGFVIRHPETDEVLARMTHDEVMELADLAAGMRAAAD